MGVRAKNPADVVRVGQAPTGTDTAFEYGTIWVDTATDDVYCYASQTAGAANWTILGNTVATPLSVASGGTGRATLTANATLVGNGTTAVKMIGPGTNGQVYLSATAAAPAWATLTSGNTSILFTPGANTLDLAVAQATAAQLGGSTLATGAEAIAGTDASKIITPSTLASKLGTQTNHGVLVGATTAGALTALTAGTNGQVLVGSTGLDPVFATIASTDGSVSSALGAGTLGLTVTQATTTQLGGSTLATDAEVTTATDSSKLVVPSTLNTRLGTQTAHGVVLGGGGAGFNLGVTAAGTDGQVLLGSTGADCVFGTLSSGNTSITFTPGAGSLALAVTAASTTQVGGSTFLTDSEMRVGTEATKFANAANVTALKAYTDITFKENPLLQSAATTGAAPSGATGDTNLMLLESGEIMEQFILGAGQTIIAPRMTATGLLTSLDLTNTEGAEYNWGAARTNSKHAFTIGTSAAFFVELTVNAADVGGLAEMFVGFRISQANDATMTNYTDFACIGAHAATAADVCVIATDLNNAGETYTNTTDAWTDGQTKVLRVNVSDTGVVTYTINGVAPTATAAFTFDNGDVVCPFVRHLFNAGAPGAINWVQIRCGLQ